METQVDLVAPPGARCPVPGAWCLVPETGRMAKQLRSEEEWIRQCIEAATPGSSVVQHDDGSSPRMHDLDVWVGNDCIGAVEISAAVDPAAMELWKLITTPGQWTDQRLSGGWMVTVSRTARARDLKAHLPGLLRALESQDRRCLADDVYGHRRPEHDLADSLGIESAYRSEATSRPGSVYVVVGLPAHQSGGGAPDTADCVAGWLGEWLRRDDQRDNLIKLARSGAPERHIRVLVAGHTPAPFDVNYALMSDDVALPTTALDLPSEITHCWVLSTWSSGRGLVWSPAGWAFFDKLQSRRSEQDAAADSSPE
jgi:hypothetical protein